MSNELQIPATTGLTLYAQLLDPGGRYWNTATALFEAYTAADWTAYAIAMTETPAHSGEYIGNLPAVAPGTYRINYLQQAGGTPATTDSLLSSQVLGWSGVGTLTPVQVVFSPVQQNGAIELRAGDSYQAEDGLAIVIPYWGPINLTGATITLQFWSMPFWRVRPRLSVTGTVLNPGALPQLLQFQPASTDTGRLAPYSDLRYDVKAALADGNITTLATGRPKIRL
jgi:hypothetical protein